jgi:lysophospholipase L1-like esterase
MGLTWLAIGDSITFGTGSTSTNSYIYRTRYQLLKNKKIHQLINSGIGGQRADTLISLHKSRGGKCDPDLVTIMVGTNDITANITTSAYKTNLGLLIDEVQKGFIVGQGKIVLLTIPWRNDGSTGIVQNYNDMVKQIGSERNIPVCDIYPAFSSASFLTDTVHPNDNGHLAIANILIPFLNGLDVWNNTRSR